MSSKATDFLVSLSEKRQRGLCPLLKQLAQHPSQIGHYSLPDDTGREIQFILVRDYLIVFCADHAVRQFRIVDIEEI